MMDPPVPADGGMPGVLPRRWIMRAEPIALDESARSLLKKCGLPVSDLHADARLTLLGLRDGARLIGVVGVERLDRTGLLRSLAVDEACRGSGHGRRLVACAESQAVQQGVQALYLLTVGNAAAFFAGLGYVTVPRAEAPPEIAATAQFSRLCPASAVLMRKALT